MSSATTPKTIDLGGPSVQHEAVAGGAITPGMLVQRSSATAVVAHSTGDGPATPSFAVENDLVGRGITDAYAQGEQVIFRTFAAGARVYAILATGQNVSAGARLASAGNGHLKAATTGDNVVAVALEAVNATSAAARIRVEVSAGFGI